MLNFAPLNSQAVAFTVAALLGPVVGYTAPAHAAPQNDISI